MAQLVLHSDYAPAQLLSESVSPLINCSNYIVTFLFVTVTCLIAIVVPNVTTVIAILGGTCSVSLQFTFPRKFIF